MAQSVYIATTESHCGKSFFSLGIMELMLRKTSKVGYFRPIIKETTVGGVDNNIQLILNHFNLTQDKDKAYGFTRKQANELIAQGKYNEVLEGVINRYKALEQDCDFILCEGTDFLGETSNIEFDINEDIVKNLNCPVILVGNGKNRSIDEAVNSLTIAVDDYRSKECSVVGAFINRVAPEVALDFEKQLIRKINNKYIQTGVVPSNELLNSPTISEIAEALDAKVLFGQEFLDNQAFRFSITAMQLQNYLKRLSENMLVIAPGDRGEIILSALMAQQSKTCPNLSAILMTTGLTPSDSVMDLLSGIEHQIPILSVELNTYETAVAVEGVHSYIHPDNKKKINLCLELFERYIDTNSLGSYISSFKPKGITPRMFEYQLTEKAKSNRKRIVLPEGNDDRVLLAAYELMKKNVVDLTILGKVEAIEASLNRLRINDVRGQIQVVDPQHSVLFDGYADKFFELRQHKGATMDIAREMMCDLSYFGTMMVLQGDADGMVSGAAHTTQATIRPALQLIKTKPGVKTVSSVFFMCLEDKVLVYGDCAINPTPNAEQLAEIAMSSAETAESFGIEAKVAMLSYSSGSSGKGEEVDKVRKATEVVKNGQSNLKIEGPIQYDAAVDVVVGQKKMPNSEVAGKATVLIFPDLNTGNNTYKAVQRETGALAIGPVLQGLNKPVNDLSRGCLVKDIINTVIITAIQAQID